MKSFTRRGLFGKVATLIQSSPTAKPRHKRAFTARPRIEALEDRLVPTTFTVNTLADTVDANPAVTSLREAITAANSQAGDDIINFSVAGTINLTGALPDLSSNIQIQGPGAASLTVRRDTGGDYRIFTVAGGPTVVLDGLTISNGLPPDIDGAGGGLRNNGGTLTVSNSTLSGNSARQGGGIYSFGTLTVSNSTLSGNSAYGDNGGGYGYGGGITNNSGTLTVNNSTLSGNSASYLGGGIANRRGGTLTVSNSTLSGNSAGINGGGGIANDSEGTLTVSNVINSTLSGNSAGIGGGIFNWEGALTVSNSTLSSNSGGGITNWSGALSVSNSTLSSNSASGVGGGITNNGGALTVSNSTLSGNSARQGGGIYNFGALTVSNSTLSGNSANNGSGGGIYSTGALTVSNSTLSGNSANNGSGGGIYNNAYTLTLNNTIVANSTAGGDVANFGDFTGSHNLIEDGSDGLRDTITGDPNLGPLANNGGPTLTHALLAGSPAIDAGDNRLADDPITGLPLATDQRGLPYARINGGRVDIGAFESPGPVVIGPDPCDPSQTALFVTGTAGNDTIVINPAQQGVTVRFNGTELGTFQPTGRILVYGLAGNDDIQVAGSITNSAWLYGGDGDDRLKGGAGNDVLLGGEGDDLLVGGSGRDILIGGVGADRIVGNADDDILLAGATAFDGNETALCAILAEWTSARAYATRIANLMGTGSGTPFDSRLNGNIFLKADGAGATVFDDGAADVLTGSEGQDWFFANLQGGGVKDKITDLGAAEFALDLVFIQGP